MQFFHGRHFRDAGRAPGGPEIKKYDLALEINQANAMTGGTQQPGLERIIVKRVRANANIGHQPFQVVTTGSPLCQGVVVKSHNGDNSRRNQQYGRQQYDYNVNLFHVF
jgi:hypothetical protein